MNDPDAASAVKEWAVGITTAPRKRTTLTRCLQSLAAAGWDCPRIFAEPGTQLPPNLSNYSLTQRDETLGAFPNWYLGLCELIMRQPEADAYFMCQDDVVFSIGLRGYWNERLWPSERVGVVSAYCPEHWAQEKKPGFYIETHGWDSWGALAYVFPNISAYRFISDPEVIGHRRFGVASGLRNIDGVVGHWCQRQGLPYFVHVPSLACHIGRTSTLWPRASNHGRRQAGSFWEEIVEVDDLS